MLGPGADGAEGGWWRSAGKALRRRGRSRGRKELPSQSSSWKAKVQEAGERCCVGGRREEARGTSSTPIYEGPSDKEQLGF